MNLNDFEKELKLIDVELTQNQKDQLLQYFELLIEYNEIMNLTGITEKDQVYLKHFYDSLTIVKAINLKKEISLCDIGTGAGFPGMVLKIVFPHLKITLLDSLNKRVEFLKVVIDKLNLKDIEVVHSRAEDYALNNRNRFDVTTARAVAHLAILLEYAIPMTKENKYFIPMKANVDNELEEIDNALKQLNCEKVDIIKFKLPFEESNRTIIKFIKKKDNKNYPRKNSEIKKSHL